MLPVRFLPAGALDFDPILGAAGGVGAVDALGNDALQAVLIASYQQALGIRESFGQAQARMVGALNRTLLLAEADAMHALLVNRADRLIGSPETSGEEDELVAIGEVIESYEAVRWPEGKVPGGKG